MSNQRRLLVVAFTERPPRTRLISARQATRRERRDRCALRRRRERGGHRPGSPRCFPGRACGQRSVAGSRSGPSAAAQAPKRLKRRGDLLGRSDGPAAYSSSTGDEDRSASASLVSFSRPGATPPEMTSASGCPRSDGGRLVMGVSCQVARPRRSCDRRRRRGPDGTHGMVSFSQRSKRKRKRFEERSPRKSRSARAFRVAPHPTLEFRKRNPHRRRRPRRPRRTAPHFTGPGGSVNPKPLRRRTNPRCDSSGTAGKRSRTSRSTG